MAKGSLLPPLCAEVSGRLGASRVAAGDARAGPESADREPRRRSETRGAEDAIGSGGMTSDCSINPNLIVITV